MIDFIVGADSRKQTIRLFAAPSITATAVDKAAALSHLFRQLNLHASTITIPEQMSAISSYLPISSSVAEMAAASRSKCIHDAFFHITNIMPITFFTFNGNTLTNANKASFLAGTFPFVAYCQVQATIIPQLIDPHLHSLDPITLSYCIHLPQTAIASTTPVTPMTTYTPTSPPVGTPAGTVLFPPASPAVLHALNQSRAASIDAPAMTYHGSFDFFRESRCLRCLPKSR
jgi:hypothetical protein